MTGDPVEDALGDLNPEDRALIELSVVREVSDAEIAGYLGIAVEQIRERRESALDAVATRAGHDSRDGRQLVLDHVRGDTFPTARAAEPEPAPEVAEPMPQATEPAPQVADPALAPAGVKPVAEVTASPPKATPPKGDLRSRIFGPTLVGFLFAVFTIALVLALRGNDDSVPSGAAPATPNSTPNSTSATATSTAPARPEAVQARLAPLGGGRASGTAALTGQGADTRLRLSVRGLPAPARARYTAWLYDSVSDARRLASSSRGDFTVSARLPAGYRRYGFIDVSREPADGNRNHSGQSVLRVPLRSVAP